MPECALDTGPRARILNLAFVAPMPNLCCRVAGVGSKMGFSGKRVPGHILEITDQVHVWVGSRRDGDKDKAGRGGDGRPRRGCKQGVLHTTAAESPLEEHPHPSARRTVTLQQHLQGQPPLPTTPSEHCLFTSLHLSV